MMKRNLFVVIIAGLLSLCSCRDVTVGYLQTQEAVYVPDSMVIRLVLDETLDAYRIYNLSPWVSPKLQGVIGTSPLLYEVVGVESPDGGDARMFRQLLGIRGGGRMEFPLFSDITAGHYVVSIRVYNEGYSELVDDVFTFVVQ